MPNALIWGASGGIGSALVQTLKSHDWQVVAVARHTEHVPDTVDHTYEFNAEDEHSFQQVTMFAAQEVSEFDLVAYAVGDLTYEKLDRMAYDGWQATINSNLNGAFLAAHHSLPLLKKGGHMFFIGAYIDHVRLPKMGAYAVAKAGLEELVNLLAKENRRKNFTLVRPGAVDTNFWEQVSFSKPDDAKAPTVVAQAIIDHYQSEADGALDL
jgi:3-oxoacyl-[acyl-carrier protein] reductase